MPCPKSKTAPPMRALVSDPMLLKIVSLFLVFIVVLGMFGKLSLLLPKKMRTAKCPTCGRHRIGQGACPCGKG